MDIYGFEEVSFVGRIAYGIMCAEEYLTQQYPCKNWILVFESFWKITNLDLWDDWMDEVIEIIPQYLFEFNDYQSSDFEYLTSEKYNELKNLYNGTGSDVNSILNMVYELANTYAYSSIDGNGKESLNKLYGIISFLRSKNIPLPDAKEVKKHVFSEKGGWGNPFDGKSLSKIL